MKVRTDTRDRLIVAARDLFLEQGYVATSMAQILHKAEVNSGSLYYFFPTKEALLIAVLEWYRDNIQPELLDPIFKNLDDPIERVMALLEGYRKMLIMTECTQGCPIGNLALELSDTHPEVRALIATNFTNWKNAVKQCFDDAADRLPTDVDRDQLASFILSVMEGGVMQARAYKSLEPYDSALAQVGRYFLNLHTDRLIEDDERAKHLASRTKKGNHN